MDPYSHTHPMHIFTAQGLASGSSAAHGVHGRRPHPHQPRGHPHTPTRTSHTNINTNTQTNVNVHGDNFETSCRPDISLSLSLLGILRETSLLLTTCAGTGLCELCSYPATWTKAPSPSAERTRSVSWTPKERIRIP